jgi:hypothetical protein
VDGLITKQSHAQNERKNLIVWQAAPPYRGLRREVQRIRYPLDWDVVSEGAQVRKVKEIAEVEQLLLNGHKKIRCQGFGIGFSIKHGSDSNA